MYGVIPSYDRRRGMRDRVCASVCHVRQMVVYVYRLLNMVCMYPFIRQAVCVCGYLELVYHSGKDNHKLDDTESVPRWTVLVRWRMGMCLGLAGIMKGPSATSSLW